MLISFLVLLHMGGFTVIRIIFLGNEDEAKAFAEANGFNEVEDLKEIAKKLVEISKVGKEGKVKRLGEENDFQLFKKNERRKRIVIITRGNLPIIVATVQQQSSANDHPADVGHSIQIEEFPALNIPTGNFVDTDGAGDAFAGGFMAAFVCDFSFHKCIQYGLFAASIIIQQKGCTFPTDFNFISDQ
jgi:adenosine kinase